MWQISTLFSNSYNSANFRDGSTSGGLPDDDDNAEEDDNEVEDNDKDDKGVSALGQEPNQTIRAN